jgi:hypothetical protein
MSTRRAAVAAAESGRDTCMAVIVCSLSCLQASLLTRAEAWPCGAGGDPSCVDTVEPMSGSLAGASRAKLDVVLSGRNRQLANCLALPLSTERSSLSRPELLDVLVVFTARAQLLFLCWLFGLGTRCSTCMC